MTKGDVKRARHQNHDHRRLHRSRIRRFYCRAVRFEISRFVSKQQIDPIWGVPAPNRNQPIKKQTAKIN